VIQKQDSTLDYQAGRFFSMSTLVIHIPRKRASRTRMTQQDELLVLMRLRLNLLTEDLAYRFGKAKSTVTYVFNTLIIERPLAFQPRAQTYNIRNTTHIFLIAVTPAGTISFVSRFWGGCVSDKHLTQQSGFLQLLEPGDTVLADRGFDILDDIGVHVGKFAIPEFTR